MPSQRHIDLFNFSPVPMWVYETETFHFLAANEAAEKEYGYTEEEFLSLTIQALWPEEDVPKMMDLVWDRVKSGLPIEATMRHIKRSGEIKYVELKSRALPSWGEKSRIVSAIDVTQKINSREALQRSLNDLVKQLAINGRSAELSSLEREVFELNAKKGVPIEDILHYFLKGIEKMCAGMSCSVLRKKNQQLYNWASPSLPKAYTDSIDGYFIGDNTGSCGTAAALKKQVIVADIENDPRWADYRHLALPHNLRACWSHPIIDSTGQVIATFAMYYREPREPNAEEKNIIERSGALLQVILENRKYSEALSETALLMRQAQELAHFGNWSIDLASEEVQWSDSLYSIFGLDKDQSKAGLESYLSVLHPDHKEREALIIQHAIETAEDCEFENRIIRPTGEVRFLRWWIQVKKDGKGKAEKMIGACLDITESKRGQQELEARESKLQSMVELYVYVNKATDDAIYDWDIKNDHIEWGDSYHRVFGHEKQEVLHPLEKWMELIHAEDLPDVEGSFSSALQDPGRKNWGAEYRLRRASGEYAYVEENGYILRNEAGEAVRMIGVLRDISERKIAEAELQASKNRYSDLFHLSPQPMWVYDIKTLRFLDVNQAAVHKYGYSAEEFLSMTIKDIRPAKDIVQLEKTLREEVSPGKFHHGPARHIKKSGKLIYVNINGNSLSYAGRDARIVVAIDCTDRLKAEEALLRSEHRFKRLIQEGSDLIAILDDRGNFQYVSPAVERVLGLGVEDLDKTNVFDAIHHDDLNYVQTGVLLLRQQKRVELEPFRLFVPNKEVRWIETILTDMRDNPAVGGIVANSRDVTQRMEQELKTRELLDRYNIVSKATSDAIWDSNILTGEIVWNHALTGIFGYRNLVVSHQWWESHVHPEDMQRVQSLIQGKMQGKESRWTSEYRFQCADGTYKFVLDRGFLIYDESGHPVRMIGSMQDISERVKYIRMIEQHNNRLRDIAWTQSHLVRAPLASIMGMVPLIADSRTDEVTRKTLLSYLMISAQDLDKVIMEIVYKSQV